VTFENKSASAVDASRLTGGAALQDNKTSNSCIKPSL